MIFVLRNRRAHPVKFPLNTRQECIWMRICWNKIKALFRTVGFVTPQDYFFFSSVNPITIESREILKNLFNKKGNDFGFQENIIKHTKQCSDVSRCNWNKCVGSCFDCASQGACVEWSTLLSKRSWTLKLLPRLAGDRRVVYLDYVISEYLSHVTLNNKTSRRYRRSFPGRLREIDNVEGNRLVGIFSPADVDDKT